MQGSLYKRFLFIFIVHIAYYHTVGQKTQFERYTVENGLQNNIVFEVAQDAKGMLWFATSTGIDRFDGNKFRSYTLPQKNKTFTEYLQIQHIVADVKKQIWAASNNSLFLYNVKKDAFELPAMVNEWLEKNKTITSLSITNDGKDILIGNNNGFAIYKTVEQKIIQPNDFNQYVRAVYQDKKGLLWVGTNKGLLRFIVNNNAISELKDESIALIALQGMSVNHISQDEQNRYWLAANNKGVFVYDETTSSLKNINIPGNKNYAVKDIFHNKKTNEHFISLDGGGVAVINNDLQIVNKFQTNEDDITSLSNNASYDIFSDGFNRIWITTYGGGVNVMSQSVQPFVNFSHQINNNNSLSNNAAKAIAEDSEGNLWLGTRKGISKLNRASQNWQHFNEDNKPAGFTADNVLAISASDNEIFVGTYGGGLMRVDSKTGRIVNYLYNQNDTNSIGTDYVYAVCNDSKGRVWSGGIRGSISYFDKGQNEFYRIQTSVTSVNCIVEDSKQQIIIGTEKGVFLVVGNKLENFFEKNISERVLSIIEYTQGVYWIGTLGSGIIEISKEKGIIQKFNAANGLPSDVICGMVKDNNGDVWIGTSKGVAHYQSKTKLITAYTKADGLAGSQVNYGAAYYTKKGEVVFGTTDGFSLFHPQNINMKGYRPTIALTELIVNNKKVKIDDEDSPLKVQLDEIDELILKSNQNSFSIDFVNTSPTVSGKHLYSWKLEGFDKNWSQPTTNPVAVYTNLNSGKYTLLIKAFAKGQSEDAQIRKLKIVIKAPWWRTGWAFAGYLLLLAAGSVAAYNYYNIRNTRKKYADRLQLNTSISHEIRTPLTLIKGPVNALANATNLSEGEKTNLELAKKNIEKLENIISQFIDYQKTGMRKMQMQVVKGNLIALVDDITSSFIPIMKEKNIHFTYSKPSEVIYILYDKDKMEKVLNNLLSNAVKYTPSQKDISVEITKGVKDVIIHVNDTGIGIPAEQQRFIFNGYFRADNTINLKETGSGIGLNVAKELVEMHKGKIEFKSDAKKGTVFTIRLPLVNDALQPFLVNESYITNELTIPAINNEEPKKIGQNKILIAEDNDELRAYLKAELAQAGYKVSDAPNGAKALQMLQKSQPDLIITDVMMPELNGFQLCSAVKKEISTCHIPVIMLTAIHDKDYLLEGYRSGADDYVKKPFDVTYIITRAENLLQNRTRFRNKIMSVFEQEETVVTNDADISWLKKVTELILENLQEPDFSVEKLSTLMTMSRPVLFRRFKAISGDSPQHYINQVRLRKAVELLQQRQLNISEVAFECGFSDPKYFSTAFKKQFGKTPGEYVKG